MSDMKHIFRSHIQANPQGITTRELGFRSGALLGNVHDDGIRIQAIEDDLEYLRGIGLVLHADGKWYPVKQKPTFRKKCA